MSTGRKRSNAIADQHPVSFGAGRWHDQLRACGICGFVRGIRHGDWIAIDWMREARGSKPWFGGPERGWLAASFACDDSIAPRVVIVLGLCVPAVSALEIELPLSPGFAALISIRRIDSLRSVLLTLYPNLFVRCVLR